ncbi:hypothetical protein M406DRAFT_262831, partial [Cryphonectria parasitica EP155]
ITTGCFAASNAISKTSPALRLFIRGVREARVELDATLAEIQSLDGVLDILKDDATSFPPDLARRTPALLEHCTAIINQIEGYMHVCNGLGLTAREKKFRWLAIKGDMVKLRFTLEGYKSILAVVTDLVGLTKSRRDNDGLSVSSDSSRYLEAVENQAAANDDIKNDLTHIMADMGSLRGRLQGDFRSNYAVSDLESYLDAMQLHATNLNYRMEAERLDNAEEGALPRIPRRAAGREDHRHASAGSNSSSLGDEPDSAIDMNDGPPFPSPRSPTREKEPSLRSSSSQLRPPTAASSKAGSVRSTSSRLSSVFHRLSSFRRPRNEVNTMAATAVLEEDAEPDDIFGVSLKKSMQMASASVRTHHDGSKASSRREFPRCVFMCVTFVKENGGVRVPNIFGGDYSIGCGSDSIVRVAALKEAFSTAPYYGEGNIDWSAHDVYDAAELIILFLQQLRKPLITETVAKRWIVMSKQATLPGSMGMRLDSCIDFWDEALLGIRGPARSLFKLLLNLWGDVADAAELNDMTAERLASRLLNPLMHLPAGKYTTDYMLGLAFLIRKRSEYAIMLREGRKSHAAF